MTTLDRQVPNGNQVFLDHVGHFVADLDRAGAALERLGFAPSAVNLQTNLGADGMTMPSGTSNRLVRLRRGFLEFLAATHDTPLAQQLATALSRYRGLHLIALSHADLASQRERLLRAGLAMQNLIEMRRAASEPGLSGEVGWSILRTQPGVMAEGRIQYVYPHTPALSWPPGSMDHPNGADSLTGALICVADLDEAQRRYGTFSNRPCERGRIALDRGILRITDAKGAAQIVPRFDAPSLPCIAAVTVAVRDLAETRRLLDSNGISPFGEDADALWIGPRDALGCYLCFHSAGHHAI